MTVSTVSELTPQMFGEPNAVESVSIFADLTANDRCDRCGAAALAQIKIPGVDSLMLMCGHHFRDNREKFDSSGYEYHTSLEGVDAGRYTWASHNEPWENQFRDAGSASA